MSDEDAPRDIKERLRRLARHFDDSPDGILLQAVTHIATLEAALSSMYKGAASYDLANRVTALESKSHTHDFTHPKGREELTFASEPKVPQPQFTKTSPFGARYVATKSLACSDWIITIERLGGGSDYLCTTDSPKKAQRIIDAHIASDAKWCSPIADLKPTDPSKPMSMKTATPEAAKRVKVTDEEWAVDDSNKSAVLLRPGERHPLRILRAFGDTPEACIARATLAAKAPNMYRTLSDAITYLVEIGRGEELIVDITRLQSAARGESK